MCETTLGTYIGRFKKFRKEGEENENFEELGKPRKSGNRLHAVADLYFDETANDLPKLGNVKDYLTKLADSSPDMFGSSIVFHSGDVTNHEWEDEDGEKQSRTDASILSLLATDLVDSPAATDGLFSEFSSDEMAIQVTHFLDQHPEVYELAANHPEVVEQFMQKYSEYKTIKTEDNSNSNQIIEIMKKEFTEKFNSLKAWVTEKFKVEGSEESNIPEEAQTKLDELEAKINEVGDQEEKVAELEGQVETLTTEKATAETDLATATAKVETLETDLVKAKAGSTNVDGLKGEEDSDNPANPDIAAWNNEANKIKTDLGIEV